MNAYARWAMLVAKVISAPQDPRTLVLWARHVGVSVATIRARCKVADVAVLPSRDLGRMLRVVARSNRGERCWDPAAQLETCDPRTLRRLLVRGGLANWPIRDTPPSVERFLQRQRFVPGRAVVSVRLVLAGRLGHGADAN